MSAAFRSPTSPTSIPAPAESFDLKLRGKRPRPFNQPKKKAAPATGRAPAPAPATARDPSSSPRDDSGVAEEARPRHQGAANRRLVLTCVTPDMVSAGVLKPTADPADRAHGKMGTNTDRGGLSFYGFLPAARRGVAVAIEEAAPREYHPTQMTSRGVGHDSAFDELHEAQLRLAGIPGIGRGEVEEMHGDAERELHRAIAAMGPREFMAATRRRVMGLGVTR